jgi:hypothetical protein
MPKRSMHGQQPMNQWQYYEAQQRLYDQGYIKKPNCGCGKKKKKVVQEQPQQEQQE